jgi:hypothetical protein
MTLMSKWGQSRQHKCTSSMSVVAVGRPFSPLRASVSDAGRSLVGRPKTVLPRNRLPASIRDRQVPMSGHFVFGRHGAIQLQFMVLTDRALAARRR